MAVQAMGPTYAGGTQPIVKGGYAVLYLPDVNNSELQKAGEAPVFYYIPNIVRMARKDGPDSGDFLFSLRRFAGTGGAGVIGGGGEVAGGLLTFTVTGAIPEDVRRQAESEITSRFTGSPDVFWGIRNSAKPPMFRPAIIASSTTSVSNVSPTPRGLPAFVSGTKSVGSPSIRYFGMPGQRDGAKAIPARVRDGAPAPTVPAPGAPPLLTDGSGSNLDPWYWQMQGEGAGSIDPNGTHALSALIGSYPAAICWAGFHGTASPLIVIQNYKLKVWSPVVTLDIVGNWDRVFQHFSAAASGRYLWASVDIKAEFNKMRINGTITVDVKVDTTLPGAEEIAKQIDQRSTLVYEKFMEQAKQRIFDPPQPNVEAAQASSSGGSIFSPWGVGLALKYRRDETKLSLEYHEKRQFCYLQDHTISSSLAGMFDEMKKDPAAEKKYFETIYLDDWPRKLARVCRPVASWSDKTIEFMSAQVGYPNTAGEINWEGHAFSGDEGEKAAWTFQTAQKLEADVANKPQDWKPDLTYIKRTVHLAEPPDETTDPYRRIQIERNEIDLDPGPNGSLINDTIVEVRADSAGRLAVGPISIDVVLTENTQRIEAIFEAVDEDSGQPIGSAPVRFAWGQADLDRDRSWLVFTGDPQFRPFYRYKVIVTVKGTIFEPGRSWEGPWTPANGNGPLIVTVPRPNGPGVVSRAVPDDLLAAAPAALSAAATPPLGTKSMPVEGNGHARYLDYEVG